MPVLDLKLDYPQNSQNFGRGDLTYVYRQTYFFSGYGLLAKAYLQAICKPFDGINCSPFESEIIVEKAKDVFAIGDHAEGNILKPGQMIWMALDINEPPGDL